MSFYKRGVYCRVFVTVIYIAMRFVREFCSLFLVEKAEYLVCIVDVSCWVSIVVIPHACSRRLSGSQPRLGWVPQNRTTGDIVEGFWHTDACAVTQLTVSRQWMEHRALMPIRESPTALVLIGWDEGMPHVQSSLHYNSIITIVNTRDDFRNVSVTVSVTAVGVVEVGVVDTCCSVSQPGADAER